MIGTLEKGRQVLGIKEERLPQLLELSWQFSEFPTMAGFILDIMYKEGLTLEEKGFVVWISTGVVERLYIRNMIYENLTISVNELNEDKT